MVELGQRFTAAGAAALAKQENRFAERRHAGNPVGVNGLEAGGLLRPSVRNGQCQGGPVAQPSSGKGQLKTFCKQVRQDLIPEGPAGLVANRLDDGTVKQAVVGGSQNRLAFRHYRLIGDSPQEQCRTTPLGEHIKMGCNKIVRTFPKSQPDFVVTGFRIELALDGKIEVSLRRHALQLEDVARIRISQTVLAATRERKQDAVLYNEGVLVSIQELPVPGQILAVKRLLEWKFDRGGSRCLAAVGCGQPGLFFSCQVFLGLRRNRAEQKNCSCLK